MRLLRFGPNGGLSLTEDLTDCPPYAILSHTWGDDKDEVTYDDINNQSAKVKTGYRKIQFCMERARQDGLDFCWVDTCCINKSDAVELSTAINSMFRWYRNSSKCYVYLADVPANKEDPVHYNNMPERLQNDMEASRWFKRGWTLQELIAPNTVQFFSSDERLLGDKASLEQLLWKVTRIPARALRGGDLLEFTAAERMSWAARRETKREEDKVYSLLGIFGIFLPPIYGEGEQHARERLWFELERRTARRHQPIADTTDTPRSAWHPVRGNYQRVHVTIIHWEIDQVVPLVERLSDVFRRLYLYEVNEICLAPGYPAAGRDFPWQNPGTICSTDLQILYYIGAAQPRREPPAEGFMDILAASHSPPHQVLAENQNWLSTALAIPNLYSDVLVVLDCYWAAALDDNTSNITFLHGGPTWARYAVLFAGYTDETSPVGRFSDCFVQALHGLANTVEGGSPLASCAKVIEEVRRGLKRSQIEARPKFIGTSLILSPLWA